MTAAPAARRPRPAPAPLTEQDAAKWRSGDLVDLSDADSRALLQRINLSRRPSVERFQLVIELLIGRLIRRPDNLRSLMRVPLMGRRSATHRLRFIQLLVSWRQFADDDWLNVEVARFVSRLTTSQWRRMSETQCAALRAWLKMGCLATSPAAQGIALIHRMRTMTMAYHRGFETDTWTSDCLERWIAAHAGRPAPVPASLVHQLLQSEDARTRALAFALLGTHELLSDLDSPQAP